MPNDCVEFTGSRDKDGYGLLTDHGRTRRANRVFWERANSMPVPKGKMVLHTCDNPPCVKAEHLYVGTSKDNARDRSERNPEWREKAAQTLREKGHRNKPGQVPNAKLTAAQVSEIRRLYQPNPHRLNGGLTQRAIAEMFGVAQTQVSKIIRGEQWPLESGGDITPQPATRTLTEDQITTIRTRYVEEEISQQALANEYGVHQTYISYLIRTHR